ncbi:MAG: protein kinase [Acidimicrobiia bacterium]|nr:protein kinase [Acidimicrobiia bacterium]
MNLLERGAVPADVEEVEGLDRYDLGDVLGRRAGTCVQRARRRGLLATDVAVKRRVGQARGCDLEREARLLDAADHPNLVRLLDVVADVEGVALVLPLARGGSLAGTLRRGPLSAPSAVDLLLDITAGVASLHRVGIVHGDLKPANVLLTSDGRPLVADLGSAARQGDPARGRGSGAYAAPELVAGATAAFSQDVYGLGATALALLTCRPPDRGRGAADLGVSRQLAAVLDSAVELRLDERFPSASALWAALAGCPEAARLAGGRLDPLR